MCLRPLCYQLLMSIKSVTISLGLGSPPPSPTPSPLPSGVCRSVEAIIGHPLNVLLLKINSPTLTALPGFLRAALGQETSHLSRIVLG